MIFNFHHRVVETRPSWVETVEEITLTFTIGWLKLNVMFINIISDVFFNFHHRVVETYKKICGQELPDPLTFTIGWLKLSYVRIIASIYLSLTFTIGWLKPKCRSEQCKRRYL